MITPQTIRVALQGAIAPVLTARGFAAQWDNVDYEPIPGTPWARVYIDALTPVRETLVGSAAGGLTYEGAVNVDLFTPQNTGPAAGEACFHALAEALTEARFFLTGGVLEVQPLAIVDQLSSAPWFQTSTRADFQIFNVPA